MIAMKVLLLLACTSVVAMAASSNLTLLERIARLESSTEGLRRQVSLQAFYAEEMKRTTVYSGIINTPLKHTGSKNYFSDSHTSESFMGLHDHPDLERTVALSEMSVVLNGYQFRTRHNDYDLIMPSNTKQAYHATEKIPLPAVPDSVLSKTSVKEQIAEMREYFKAFARQARTGGRDFHKYFLPHLCYMEGAWTNLSSNQDMEEPFDNNRHHFDASSWEKLLERAEFQAYTGSQQSQGGGEAVLPRSMVSGQDGKALYVQWQYRILCHPIKEDLPTLYLKPVDDLSTRLPKRLTAKEALDMPGQRFFLNDKSYDGTNSQGNALMDKIMNQIPGMNNYPGHLEDHTMGGIFKTVRGPNRTFISVPLNTNFYHRFFSTANKGAMGTKTAYRGYNDANMWVAQTTHSEVLQMKAGRCRTDTCSTHAAYSFAIPLEIIYTTPLARWNPYRLPEQEERQNLPVRKLHVGEGTDEEIKKYYEDRVLEPKRIPVDDVTEGGQRNGAKTQTLAFNGTSAEHFYKTPVEFYQKSDDLTSVGVLDGQGQLREVVSSGIRTFTPYIPGVGRVRLRYPIAPLSGEGQTVSKELNALKDIVLNTGYTDVFVQKPCGDNGDQKETQNYLEKFKLPSTDQTPPGSHSHFLELPSVEMDKMVKNPRYSYKVATTTQLAHTHELEVMYDQELKQFVYKTCDGLKTCWDGHPNDLHDPKERKKNRKN